MDEDSKEASASNEETPTIEADIAEVTIENVEDKDEDNMINELVTTAPDPEPVTLPPPPKPVTPSPPGFQFTFNKPSSDFDKLKLDLAKKEELVLELQGKVKELDKTNKELKKDNDKLPW